MSKIEWTDETWNVTTGCTRVSEECDNCYAVQMTKRLAEIGHTKEKYGGLVNKGKDHFNGKVKCHPEVLEDAFDIPEGKKVFVNSMSDLFHPEVPFEFIDKVFAVMAMNRNNIFQILTKRPERMAKFLKVRSNDVLSYGWTITGQDGLFKPLPNVWLGTSCGTQEAANDRIPHLLKCPAAVRFLSCEPLLGPVDLTVIQDPDLPPPYSLDSLNGYIRNTKKTEIHWVIAGGESGHKARPMHPDWVRGLRDQCQEADVPFFFKQWGKYRYAERKPFQGPEAMGHSDYWYVDKTGAYAGYPATLGMGIDDVDDPPEIIEDGEPYPELIAWKVGKKESGHWLDGQEYQQFPNISP